MGTRKKSISFPCQNGASRATAGCELRSIPSESLNDTRQRITAKRSEVNKHFAFCSLLRFWSGSCCQLVSKVPGPMMIQHLVTAWRVLRVRRWRASQGRHWRVKKRRAGGLPSGPAHGSLKIRCSVPDAIRPKVILYIFEEALKNSARDLSDFE
jgi:hypothetical protein